MEDQKSFLVFINAIKSEATKKYYINDLYAFLKFTKVKDFNTLAKLPTDKIQDHLENYVLFKRKQGIISIRPRISAIELFLEMNKVLFHKKVLHRLLPSDDNPLGGGVAYTNEDVLAMVKATKKIRTKAIVYFLASTGMRIGGFADPPLRKKHMIKMTDGCYGVRIYEGSREGYWAFLTPETVSILNQYFESRKINGEKITDESFIFATYPSGKGVLEHLDANAVTQILKRLVKASGITRVKVNQSHYDKSLAHGFRKRFNTILKLNSEVNSNIAEKLMAHKRGLDGLYFVPTIEECFEEFKKAILDLTVDQTQRQKIKIDELKKETTELKEKEKEIDKLREELEGLQEFKKESLNEIEKIKMANQIKTAYMESDEFKMKVYKAAEEIMKKHMV